MDKRYTSLDAQFRDKLTEFEKRLHENGISVKLVCGFRSVGEQNRLYAQGRTAPGKRVTNVRGGYSWHNFGLAADYAFIIDGKLSWEGPWNAFGKIARESGLEWGGDWKSFVDRPHVQWRNGKTLQALRRQNGIKD